MEEPGQDVCTNVQVLTLGLPRCANASLAAALSSDVLLFRPILRPSTSTRTDEQLEIVKALSKRGDKNLLKRREHLCKMLGQHTACAETLNALADDLMDVCPNAKLILNIQPPSTEGEDAGVAWARSCRETIISQTHPLRRRCRFQSQNRLRYPRMLVSSSSAQHRRGHQH